MDTNKNVMSGWIGSIFMLGVLAFMSYTTWHAVFAATGDALWAALSLFLFDGGAFAGYMMLVGDAKGAPQRTTAQVILWADFLLAGGMVAGALELLPPQTIKYVMLISAVFNGWAIYFYKTHKPETLEQMQEQDEHDSLVEAARANRKKLHREAMRQADANISRQAVGLGTLLSLRATSQLKYEMRLPMTDDERKAFEEDIIDVAALPAPVEVTAPAKIGLADFLAQYFGRGRRTSRHVTLSKPDEPSLSSNAPLPQDQGDQSQ